MDFLTGNTRKLYVKFLISSMCSALVVSIYSFVDTIAIGQSEGTLGAAAMAVISPFYGLLTFLAVLVGIGGSVLLGTAKGEGREEKGNAYFTASVILMAAITAAAWLAFIFFHNEIFVFFGANTEIMPKVMEYAAWLIRFFPVFIAPGFISAFIRNDNAPGLTMAAVIAGGAVNIFLDWFLVFPLGMGMRGAVVATVTGTCLQVVIMCGHFFRKKCGLKFVNRDCAPQYSVNRFWRGRPQSGHGYSFHYHEQADYEIRRDNGTRRLWRDCNRQLVISMSVRRRRPGHPASCFRKLRREKYGAHQKFLADVAWDSHRAWHCVYCNRRVPARTPHPAVYARVAGSDCRRPRDYAVLLPSVSDAWDNGRFDLLFAVYYARKNVHADCASAKRRGQRPSALYFAAVLWYKRGVGCDAGFRSDCRSCGNLVYLQKSAIN